MTVHHARVVAIAAAQGHVQGQSDLGGMYATGQGVARDFAEALRWFRLAAAQGGAGGQLNLGIMYTTGQSVPQDYAEAARWYRLAAEQGYVQAQYNLGILYIDGQGVARDFVEAHMWISLAAAQSSGEDHERLVRGRDGLAGEMTPDQVAEAQRRAREWTPTP